MATFSVAFLVMGTDAAFKPDSFEPSTLWLVVSFVLGTGAAIAGGWVAATIGKKQVAAMALAVFVFVLGLLFAIPAFMAEEPGPRGGELGNFEAMQNAAPPAWVGLANAVIGAAGALIGGRLKATPE